MKPKVTYNADHKYDIQLSQARINEERLGRILEDAKIELKSETWEWEQTGNICIEYKQDGRRSGIAATEADFWVHELKRDGQTLVYLWFPIRRLKELTRHYLENGGARTGGDGGRSQVVVIPLKDILR